LFVQSEKVWVISVNDFGFINLYYFFIMYKKCCGWGESPLNRLCNFACRFIPNQSWQISFVIFGCWRCTHHPAASFILSTFRLRLIVSKPTWHLIHSFYSAGSKLSSGYYNFLLKIDVAVSTFSASLNVVNPVSVLHYQRPLNWSCTTILEDKIRAD